MPEQSEVQEEREVEAQELTVEEMLLQFGQYSENRAAIPWEQRSFREKLGYYLDRIFLTFLFLFFLVLMGEVSYKMWYVMNMQKIQKFVLDTFSYLLTQEEDEELVEL